jgi:hypothetical protein
LGEGERLGGQGGPAQLGVVSWVLADREPFAHRGALVGVEVRAVAGRDQRRHPVGGKLDHQRAAHEHGEDLAPVAQRRAAEAGPAARRDHPVDVVELGDEILETRLGRRVRLHGVSLRDRR